MCTCCSRENPKVGQDAISGPAPIFTGAISSSNTIYDQLIALLHTCGNLHTYDYLHTYPDLHTYPNLHTYDYLHTYPNLHTYDDLHTYPDLHTNPNLHTYDCQVSSALSFVTRIGFDPGL